MRFKSGRLQYRGTKLWHYRYSSWYAILSSLQMGSAFLSCGWIIIFWVIILYKFIIERCKSLKLIQKYLRGEIVTYPLNPKSPPGGHISSSKTREWFPDQGKKNRINRSLVSTVSQHVSCQWRSSGMDIYSLPSWGFVGDFVLTERCRSEHCTRDPGFILFFSTN
jgi:hypothetical protein